MLDGADAVEELRQRIGILGRDAEFELRVIDDFQQCGAVDPGLSHAQVSVGRGAFIVLGELRRFGQCVNERLVGFRVVIAEFFGGEQHRG